MNGLSVSDIEFISRQTTFIVIMLALLSIVVAAFVAFAWYDTQKRLKAIDKFVKKQAGIEVEQD
jgi:phosphatidylglycerophosphatase A